jgi:hypothetical protein
LSHLPEDIRRAIEITPAAGITHLCSGALEHLTHR